MMMKIDLAKSDKPYYHATDKPQVVTLPAVHYLAIAGQGDPSGSAFADNLQALYSTAYTIKFACKDEGRDFVVPKLEGLWSYDENKFKGYDVANAPALVPRSEWQYKLMIRLPEFVASHHIASATEVVIKTKGIAQAAAVELFTLVEGKVVQMLHKGPFANEPQTLAVMKNFMDENHFERNGLHHEIYLSDFRRTAPEKLRTILREPVK